jgi:hypothetical protein
MAQQFANNARALLVAGISDTDTSIVIEAAKADLFPVANVGTGSLPSASSWFKVTLQNSAGAVEIVAVRTRTAGSGVLSNVIRGYDDTTPLNFVAGTVVGLRITAEDVQGALDLPNANNTFTGNNTFSGANSFAGSVSGQGLINLLYPVGSVYINATNNTNPGTLFGVGTWTAFGAGRVPVGFDSGNALFNSAEETGGSYDATLVSHNHTGTTGNITADHNHTFSGTTDTQGNHQHVIPHNFDSATAGDFISGNDGDNNMPGNASPTAFAGSHAHNYSGTTSGVSSNHQHPFTTSTQGASATNANLQPYITVYMWKRTA